MIITGNPNFGLAKSLYKLYPNAMFVSRDSGYDLTKKEDQERFANETLNHDVFINCAALWKFNQTVLLDCVYKKLVDNKKTPHIICVGSTTDRVKNGKAWLYNAEKKALRDYCNTLSLASVWGENPKITYVSLGTLTNNQDKHPDRKCMLIDDAARYIKWIIDQPKNLSINEISIDPMQSDKWYE
jgi:NADP-dependent 3-hydroxy acid dehydrogenase YdfG